MIENDIKQHSLFLEISKFTLKAHFTTIRLNITRRYAKMKITLLQNKTRRLAKLVNKIWVLQKLLLKNWRHISWISRNPIPKHGNRKKKGQSWKQMLCSERLWIWGMLYLVCINKMINLGHNNSPGTSDPYPSPKEDKNRRILELD